MTASSEFTTSEAGGTQLQALNCVSAPECDPTPKGEQYTEIKHGLALMLGSRSVPIGTPALLTFSMLHQRARWDPVVGPVLVLKS